jgi:SAM-dependent methyltransferase
MTSDPTVLKDIIEWDVLNWSRALAFWDKTLHKFDPATAKTLTLGERGGGISLWLALKGYQVVCTDRDGVQETAKPLHERYRVAERIHYKSIDAFHIPYDNDSFDIVACKSVIGGLKSNYSDPSTRTLESQSNAMDEINRVLKPGGCWLGAENLRGSTVHQWIRKRAKGDKLGWRHLAMEEWPHLLRSFSRYEVHCFGLVPTLSGHDWLNRVSYGINCALNPLTPQDWNYIVFLKAFK